MKPTEKQNSTTVFSSAAATVRRGLFYVIVLIVLWTNGESYSRVEDIGIRSGAFFSENCFIGNVSINFQNTFIFATNNSFERRIMLHAVDLYFNKMRNILSYNSYTAGRFQFIIHECFKALHSIDFNFCHLSGFICRSFSIISNMNFNLGDFISSINIDFYSMNIGSIAYSCGRIGDCNAFGGIKGRLFSGFGRYARISHLFIGKKESYDGYKNSTTGKECTEPLGVFLESFFKEFIRIGGWVIFSGIMIGLATFGCRLLFCVEAVVRWNHKLFFAVSSFLVLTLTISIIWIVLDYHFDPKASNTMLCGEKTKEQVEAEGKP